MSLDFSDCSKLPRFLRLICEKDPSVPQATIEKYHAAWQRKLQKYGGRPPMLVKQFPPDPVVPAPLLEGPGTEFKRIASDLGIEAKPGCTCESLLQKMNALGVPGCQEHRDDLIAEIARNSKNVSWFVKLRAAALAVTVSFHINPLHPLESLFDEALRRAEQKADSHG